MEPSFIIDIRERCCGTCDAAIECAEQFERRAVCAELILESICEHLHVDPALVLQEGCPPALNALDALHHQLDTVRAERDAALVQISNQAAGFRNIADALGVSTDNDSVDVIIKAVRNKTSQLFALNALRCLICGKPVPDYVPKYCCDGSECGCMGKPIDPCVCSDTCETALFENIGIPMEERRIKAGIEKWSGGFPILAK